MLSLVHTTACTTLVLLIQSASATPQLLPDLLDGSIWSSILSSVSTIEATLATPTSTAQASRRLSSVINAAPTPTSLFNFYDTITDLVAAGFTTDNVADALAFVNDVATGQNSFNNNNPMNPQPPAYPRAQRGDAPYDLTEAQLRAAIYIPPTFQCGRRGAPPPVILVPGTGDTGE